MHVAAKVCPCARLENYSVVPLDLQEEDPCAPFQSAAIPRSRSRAVAAGSGSSRRSERAIHANAATATANSMSPGTTSPKMIFPIPNRLVYTATIPAIQLVQASAPPGIG